MGYQYGIKEARETLLILSKNQSFDSRLSDAFSELGVMTEDDVSKGHFKKIKELHDKYRSIANLEIAKNGKLEMKNKDIELYNLSVNIVYLCTDIIEHNARNSSKGY